MTSIHQIIFYNILCIFYKAELKPVDGKGCHPHSFIKTWCSIDASLCWIKQLRVLMFYSASKIRKYRMLNARTCHTHTQIKKIKPKQLAKFQKPGWSLEVVVVYSCYCLLSAINKFCESVGESVFRPPPVGAPCDAQLQHGLQSRRGLI